MGWELSQSDEHLLKWARDHPDDSNATEALEYRVRFADTSSASRHVGILLLILAFFAGWAVAGIYDRSRSEAITALGLGALVGFGYWREQCKAETGVFYCQYELDKRKMAEEERRWLLDAEYPPPRTRL